MTTYNGSVTCKCGKKLTPLEAAFDKTCPKCRADNARDLIRSKMVPRPS